MNFSLIEIFDKGEEPKFIVLDDETQLRARPRCLVRFVFTGVDRSHHHYLHDLPELPQPFHDERKRRVSRAFGTKSKDPKQRTLWLRSSIKAIDIDHNLKIRQVNIPPAYPGWSQANNSWLSTTVALSWDLCEATTGAVESVDSLTLYCWSDPIQIEEKLSALLLSTHWQDILEDPYILVDIILQELHACLMSQVKNMSFAFFTLEKDILALAVNLNPLERNTEFDFIGLFNVGKHIIHLRETSLAAMTTIDEVMKSHSEYHQELYAMCPLHLKTQTVQKLKYRKHSLSLLDLQLMSLEKRVQNLNGLAFNRVNQISTKAMLQDSHTMKTITLVTLSFLPTTAVASLFSTPFFQSNGADRITITRDFWVFWTIAIPLTLLVLIGWRVFVLLSRDRPLQQKLNMLQKLKPL